MDEKLSLLVSHILDRHGYSEDMRRYRINQFEDENFERGLCSQRTLRYSILAGSKVEGTSRFNESDYDFLNVYSGVKATECRDIVQEDSDLRLYMESDTAPAGYCKLQLLQYGRGNYHRRFLRHDCYVRCPGYCMPHLSSTFVVNMEHKYWPGEQEICGPASKGHPPGMREVDNVLAIRCSHFPHSFELWFRRHTMAAAWPTKKVMEQIAKTDVFLVPVGKHGSDHQFLEWRLSFNMAEKILIQNFTTVQYKVYILLKKIMKEVVEPQSAKSVTSYILKTLMLWSVEQIPVESWRNDRLLNALVHMVKKLLSCVQRGVCSMYFIPEDNILEGRINVDTQQIVSDVLSSLLDDGCLCILKVPSIARQIHRFMSAIVPVPLQCHNQGDGWEKTSILLNRVRHIHASSLHITKRDAFFFCMCHKNDKIPYEGLLADLLSETTHAESERQEYAKYIASETVSYYALQQCVDVINQHGSNIQKYTSIRKCVRMLNRNCHANVLSGRVRFAHVLYMLGQRNTSLDILASCGDKLRYYMTKRSYRHAVQTFEWHPRLQTAIGNECLSTLQVLKYFSILDLQFDYQMELCLPKALIYEVYKSYDEDREYIWIDPETLLYLLQFLCCEHLGQRCIADSVFTNLVWCATSQQSKIEYREVALNVLGHILLRKRLYNQAARVLVKSIMVSKQYPHDPELKTNAAVWHLAILLNKQQRQ